MIAFNHKDDCWLEFINLDCEFSTNKVDEVVTILEQAESAVKQFSLYAAIFISYEASPAFDKAYAVNSTCLLPLVSAQLYRSIRVIKSIADIATHEYQGIWQPTVDFSAYSKVITKILRGINNGEYYQVNYTFPMISSGSITSDSLFFDLVKSQRSTYPVLFQGDGYSICSASPELLFSKQGKDILTCPMKGTMARSTKQHIDLANKEILRSSRKDMAENLMVVDMVRNDLSRVAKIGSVKVGSLFDIEPYPNVWQMTSKVSAVTSSNITGCLSALFPAASITGTPKISAMKTIQKLETYGRGAYTGSLGFILPDDYAQFNVAIRTATILNDFNYLEFPVGGGIVADSNDSCEYREALWKARILQK